jgi:hypothetical protein
MPEAGTSTALSMHSRIRELSDLDAVRMLRIVLESSQHLPDPETARDLAQQLAEAARQPLLLEASAAGASTLTLPRTTEPVSAGELARSTLLYLLAEQPELEPLLAGAASTARGPLGALTRPGFLDLGTQVLLALHQEFRLERGADSVWRFRVSRKALTDEALTGVLAQLVATVSH